MLEDLLAPFHSARELILGTLGVVQKALEECFSLRYGRGGKLHPVILRRAEPGFHIARKFRETAVDDGEQEDRIRRREGIKHSMDCCV